MVACGAEEQSFSSGNYSEGDFAHFGVVVDAEGGEVEVGFGFVVEFFEGGA